MVFRRHADKHGAQYRRPLFGVLAVLLLLLRLSGLAYLSAVAGCEIVGFDERPYSTRGLLDPLFLVLLRGILFPHCHPYPVLSFILRNKMCAVLLARFTPVQGSRLAMAARDPSRL